MLLLIEAYNRQSHTHLLGQSFKMRDRAFSDLVDRKGLAALQQRDRYDHLNPAYPIWCNGCKSRAYAAIRLMPTTGPNLLHGAFRNEFPDAGALSAPGIWEGAYMGIDTTSILEDLPDICAERALRIFLAGIHEMALHHGISAILLSYRAAMRSSYENSGAGFAELDRASNCDEETICCGIFEISAQTLATVRDRANHHGPIYQPPTFTPTTIRYLQPVT